MDELAALKEQLDQVTLQLLDLMSQRKRLIERIRSLPKTSDSPPSELPGEATTPRRGSASDTALHSNDVHLTLRENDITTLGAQEEWAQDQLLVNLRVTHVSPVISVRGVTIGGGSPVIIAGPCAVESRKQLSEIAKEMSQHGVRILRGGAFKPRTSPYAFQGLGQEALKYLREVAIEYGMATVTEVMDTRDLDTVYKHVDIIQVGSRNMHNSALLKEVSSIDKPVLLKRGFMATIEEFLCAAEYLVAGGHTGVILCERGIRTFERWTRSTLDISAVALLKQMCCLPVIVDISHSAGRKDIAIPLAKAALAAGADGIMVEVHSDPPTALSDAAQQLNFQEFHELLSALSLSRTGRDTP